MPESLIRIGGSFAPPLDASKINSYRDLAEEDASASQEVRHYMISLCDMCEAFLDEEESRETPEPHPSGLGTITKLEKETIERLWDHVPWPAECDAYQRVFEELPTGELRNAAYHLLWFAKELADDRQPLTNDKLPGRHGPGSKD